MGQVAREEERDFVKRTSLEGDLGVLEFPAPVKRGEVGLLTHPSGMVRGFPGDHTKMVTCVSSRLAHSGPDVVGSHQGNLKGPEKGCYLLGMSRMAQDPRACPGHMCVFCGPHTGLVCRGVLQDTEHHHHHHHHHHYVV